MKNRNNTVGMLLIGIYTCFTVAMQQPNADLRPIDRVFLMACKNNKSIDFALKNGANVRVVNSETGDTGLHYACKNGNWEMVSRLIDKDPCVLFDCARDRYNHITAICNSGKKELSEIAQSIINQRLIVVCKTPFPLEAFCEQVEKTLALGGDINYEDETGFTPLLYTCGSVDKNRIAKAKFLLEKGADIEHTL